MNGRAIFIGKASGTMRGDARHYRLDPPATVEDWTGGSSSVEHVVVSAIDGGFAYETYIFPADADGEVTSWGELDGSFQGGNDHARALRGLGYEVTA